MYIGIGPNKGIIVEKDQAFDYAIEHCFEIIPPGIHEFLWEQEFKDFLVEWFYFGNWIEGEWEDGADQDYGVCNYERGTT